MILEYLKVIAESWPLAAMVIGLAAAIVVNRRLKQAMDDSQAVRDLKASQAMVVRNRDD